MAFGRSARVEMEEKKRGGFSSKIGFVMAAASSAVGLGNLWRFPYLAADYGGGVFLLSYMLLAASFGFAMLVAEIGIGRMTRLSAVAAFRKLDRRFHFCGILGLLIPALITPYYSVIGGWVTKYIAVYATGADSAAAQDAFFGAYVSKTGEPIFWFLVFIILSGVVVLLGVDKGIERLSTILMPILLLLAAGIAVYTVTRPGAGAGIAYYLTPDFSKMNGKTILAALGQLFYSLSLAMGIMVTYGSYMRREDRIETSAFQITFFDSLVAFLAGLMIVPAVYIFSGGDESAMKAGPGLMFVTLPKVFHSFAGGRIVGLAFFALAFFAAITSSVSLVETVVSNVMDLLHWKRKPATVFMILWCIVLGIPSSLGFGIWDSVRILGFDILDFMDFLTNTLMMPILAFFTCVLVGFVLKPEKIIAEAQACGARFRTKRFFAFIIKWIAPVGIIAIMASFLAASFGWMNW